jgi:hypothetical protein
MIAIQSMNDRSSSCGQWEAKPFQLVPHGERDAVLNELHARPSNR